MYGHTLRLRIRFSSHLDFYVNAAGQFELHESVNGLGGCTVNVQKSFVRGELELLSGFLVDKSGAVYSENLGVCWKWNRSNQYNLVVLHTVYGLDDLFSRSVNQGVVE